MSKQLKVMKQPNQLNSKIHLSDGVICGDKAITIIAGPCAVESMSQIDSVLESLGSSCLSALRGCIYKPRTSPYSFQGLGKDGLSILDYVRTKFQQPVVTEVMSSQQIYEVFDYTDVFQIGSRNMQNFELLKEVAGHNKPIILKRGLSATVEEFLLSAEYILSGGNEQVILCERGIRSFDSSTRNVLDLGAVVLLKQKTHLPVIVDPSHASGLKELVPELAKAAVACGADGLLIECHPEPSLSVSDARQALSLPEMVQLIESLKPIAEAVGRSIVSNQPGKIERQNRLKFYDSTNVEKLELPA